MIRFTVTLALATFASTATLAADTPSSPAADPVMCGSVQGFNLFAIKWKADLQSALESQAIGGDVRDYLAHRADELAQAFTGQPGIAQMIRYCEDLNTLFPR